MTLTTRLDRIEAARSALLTRVALLSEAQQTQRPAPGTWSILEIIEHLVVCEYEVLGDFSTLNQREGRPRSLMNRVLFTMVMGIFFFNISVPAPSKGMLPQGNRRLR